PTVCINLTGEPTGLRMVLPGRTAVHKNMALTSLLDHVTRCVSEYFRAQASHSLPYSDWVKARNLGIELPEAQPHFTTRLNVGENGLDCLDVPESTSNAITSRLYRVDEFDDHINVYLAARKLLAKDKEAPFVPVAIPGKYMDY